MAKLLMFNIRDQHKREEIQALAFRLQARVIEVPPSRQGGTLRELLAGSTAIPPTTEPFTGEMLVMNGFERGDLDFFLNELRRTGQTVALKAVVTETNQHWPAKLLYRELLAENRAMG